MDYQYINTNQISNMDYWSLANMLLTQINVETRKQILERLTEMNNQLIMGMGVQIQPDLARPSMLNSRKKDVSEVQHPAMDRLNYKLPVQESQHSMQRSSNPVPINIPINSTSSQFNMNNSYQMPLNNYNQYSTSSQNKELQPEIDLDDIIDEITNESDELDNKLAKIKQLHTKIIADKRRRRRERENK